MIAKGSCIGWLESIFNERFGLKFNLRLNTFGDWELRLLGTEKVITISADTSTFSRSDSNLAITHWDATAEGWESVLGSPIPAPGVNRLSYPLIKESERGIHVDYDIVGLTYWMLSRQEEVARTDLDNHGRFPAISSHAFKHGYLERPIVDEWLDILSQVIQRNCSNIQLKKHKFCMNVSHDVDRPSLYVFQSWLQISQMMAGSILKRRDILSFFQAPYIKLTTKSFLHKADPFNTFHWLMDRSDEHDIRCSFNFLSDQTCSIHDANYNLNSLIIRNLIKEIHSRGHEIGLHPSYNSYLRPDQIKLELDRLQRLLDDEGIRQDTLGGRMHYLRWSQSVTLKACADAGMSYDSTLGYADRPGFRCGTCYEYPAFDPVSQEQFKLRIRPLVLMEGTVIESDYLGLGVTELAENKMQQIKNTCQKVEGNFELLWHNSSLTTGRLAAMFKNLLN